MVWKGWENYVPPIGAGHYDERVVTGEKPLKHGKYGAIKTTVDGITFDSKREAARYAVLVQRMKAGDIRRLKCQPRYALCPLIIEHGDVRNINLGANSPRRHPIAEYVADFEYEESDRGYGGVTWRLLVEDVKGAKTDIYKLKKKWFEAQYGITIRET